MNKDIESQIKRAKELLGELKKSYQKDLNSQEVSDNSRNLTQEILVKMRSVLDQAMHIFFEKKIASNLSESEKEKARIYFPIASDVNSLKSTLGRGNMTDLDQRHPEIFKFLESVQPYIKAFKWMKWFTEFSNEKHIRLTPQTKIVQERRTVSRPSRGSVSWTPKGVRFGPGVRVMGAPVDPATQNIKPTPGVTSRREIWVSFKLGDSGVNSLWLCKTVIKEVEKIISNFLSLF